MANPFDSTQLKHVATRPLNVGMYQNLPSNGLPQGAFWRIQNYRVEEQGLLRRGGLVAFDLNTATGQDRYDGKLLDIIYFYQRLAGDEQLLLTDKKLFKLKGAVDAEWISYKTFIDVTVTSNTETVDGKFEIVVPSTQEERDRVRPGDYIVVGTDFYEIASSGGGAPTDPIYCYGTVTLNELGGELASSQEVFLSEEGFGPTYAVLPSTGSGTEDKVVIADQGERGLYEYNGTELKPYVIDSTDGVTSTEYVVGGKSVVYFEDRLWIGNTEEIDGHYRQRVRWSDAINFARFHPASYVDLPYTEGQLLRLVPLGALLIAYYEDAIYTGRRTNMDGLPFGFTRVESGNVGLINARAVVRHIDLHYFVGEDNIYILSEGQGFTPIGSPVRDEAVYLTTKLGLQNEIQVEHDPKTKSIVFLFPDVADVGVPGIESLSTRLWRFYYNTNAWAYDEVHFDDSEKTSPSYYFSAILPSNTYIFGRSWEEWEDLGIDASWDGTSDPPDPLPTYSFEQYGTWSALNDSRKLATTLKIGVWSAPLSKEIIVEEALDASLDEFTGIDYPVWALLESPDFDYGMPDYTKTVTRLSVKSGYLHSERYSSLADVGLFTLNISDSMGYRWKRPMTLRFKGNYNEGYANFRSTGSTFRFKLINSQDIAPFRISEYITRLVGRGLQVEN